SARARPSPTPSSGSDGTFYRPARSGVVKKSAPAQPRRTASHVFPIRSVSEPRCPPRLRRAARNGGVRNRVPARQLLGMRDPVRSPTPGPSPQDVATRDHEGTETVHAKTRPAAGDGRRGAADGADPGSGRLVRRHNGPADEAGAGRLRVGGP